MTEKRYDPIYGDESGRSSSEGSSPSRSGSSSSRSGSSSSRSGSSSSRSGSSSSRSGSSSSRSGSSSSRSGSSSSRSGSSSSRSGSSSSRSGSSTSRSGSSSARSSSSRSGSGSGRSSHSQGSNPYYRNGSSTSGRNSRNSRRRRRRRQTIIRWVIILAIVVVALILVFAVIVPRAQTRRIVNQEKAQAEAQEEITQGYLEDEITDSIIEDIEEETVPDDPQQTILDEAELLAAMYDYDSAIECLTGSEYYASSTQMQEAVTTYQAEKDACVAWEPEQVTHIFYHTLIVDPSKAFDGDSDESGYEQYMCTIDEFNKITQIMYDEGYVMVSMHDICTINDDGTVEPKAVYLPEGKIPFVLSQDDVSYYHYMTGDGFAEKLIVDEDGKVKNTYIEDDGTVSIGDYDLVPLIDTFVEEHPDFSYHGHKGTIALTGYEGVLGYRTDEVYLTREEGRVTSYQQAFFDENPDFDEAAWQNEVDQATAVANAMKAEGWEFASHTWGHINPLAKGYNTFVQDTDRWVKWVEPIVGYTDIIIFAFGADVTEGMTPYSDSNEYFRYLKDNGFNIFCLVDSNQYFVQFTYNSMRMGRRDIDGYRMYYTPEKVDDLFNVDDVWDNSRHTPIPEI